MPRKSLRRLELTEAEVVAIVENLKRIAVAIKSGDRIRIDGKYLQGRQARNNIITPDIALINQAEWLIRKLIMQNGGRGAIMGWDFDNEVSPRKREIVKTGAKLGSKPLDNS